MLDIKYICTEINDWVINVRRDLHQTPELGLCEFETKSKIIKYLDSIGIDYISYKNHTGITAYIDNNYEKTVALRADIDALPIFEELNHTFKSIYPNKMHACGHDAHTAILLGTCKVLFSIKEQLNVNVKFFFQPAEETVGGAKLMIEDGCMENPNVDCIFGLHVMPHINTGNIELKYNTINASTDTINITIYGNKSHGAYPHQGTDAIVMSSFVISSLQTLVSRNISPTNSVVLTLGTIEGGISQNIICDKVYIKGTLRTLDSTTRDYAKDRIKDIVDLTCKSLGGKSDVYIEEGYPPLVNTNSLVDLVKKNSIELFGENNVILREFPSLGAEDFSYYLNITAGAFYHLGCSSKSKNITSPLHTSTFDIDEDCLVNGIMLHVKNILSTNFI
ncbi:MAG: M20 family metallopeptidase [Romboutsia sp.]